MIVAWCVANEELVCVTVSKLCSHQTEPKGPMQGAGFGHRPVRKSAYRITTYESEAVIHLCSVSHCYS